MPDLIAQGPDRYQRWRRSLPAGRAVLLGRGQGPWAVSWDDRISRRHAELVWRDGHLEVRALPTARNPIFWHGQPSGRFDVTPGEHFVIGQTMFSLTVEAALPSIDLPRPRTEQTFTAEYLRVVPFRDPAERIEALGRLPDLLVGDPQEQELFVRVINWVQGGVPRAEAVALVAADPEGSETAVRVLHWDRRTTGDEPIRPSERLIREAVATKQAIVHVWDRAADPQMSDFTITHGVDWAFCVPVRQPACPGWAIYVSGSFPDQPPSTSRIDDLRDDLKFVELTAETLGAMCTARSLERRQAALSPFFSPVVLETLAGQDPETALAPRKAFVTVLFCDLRGFARQSEQSADDLMGLLNRVSRALGVATHHIRETGGVVGDFHGDAVMGFWGWPIEQSDAPRRAAQAALAIQADFAAAARNASDPLAGFRAGLGLATGEAVAGKIGTVDQVKVTVFGPVVNLAARLESMTKVLRASILLDETTALLLAEQMPRSEARIRRLLAVQPAGMDSRLVVSQLIPPVTAHPQLTDDHLAHYEQALDLWLAGRWEEAFEHLHRVPAEDRAKDFLTVYIAQHNRMPPPGWDGAVRLGEK